MPLHTSNEQKASSLELTECFHKLQHKKGIFNYCCPIKSIAYKKIPLDHCIFNGRVLFCHSKPLQKIDS